jgi:hypothetical protein
VICVSIDEFWKRAYQQALNRSNLTDVMLSPEDAAHRFAASWMMIPVTRAMDTLAINLSDPRGSIGRALRRVAMAHSDFVEWLE